MDRVESLLASRRLAKWPSEWQRVIVDLPVTESTLIAELAALLDARPDDGQERPEA